MIGDGAGSYPLSLYIHIPFCRSKCSYCDFNSYAGLSHVIPAYLQAIQKEMAVWSAIASHYEVPFVARGSERLRLSTIYIGGGTPTVLAGDDIAAILSACHAEFQVDPGAEITAEANPGTIDEAHLRRMLKAGVNRLSIGVQSFNRDLLRLLGRTHTRQGIIEAYRSARAVGFDNVSLDLIYGIPTQTIGVWQEDIEQALELDPTHLSLYGLSVEKGTPLWAEIDCGRLSDPDQDLAADLYIMADEMLSDRGYTHYEISNWAVPGKSCRHNLSYWRNLPYIGVGAGAHSSFCSIRIANIRDPLAYVARLNDNSPIQIANQTALSFASAVGGLGSVAEILEIDLSTQMAETAMLNLRLAEGMDEDAFRSRFGVEPRRVFGGEIEDLSGLGLLETKGRVISLTSRGRLLGNEVFGRLLAAVR